MSKEHGYVFPIEGWVMDWKDRVDFRDLVRRFDRGDRTPDLLAQLNRAAYDCFHAPWETLPAPKPRGSSGDMPCDLVSFIAPEGPSSVINPLRPTPGRLPIIDEGDQDGPPTPAQDPRRGFEAPAEDLEHAAESEAPQEERQSPLAMLAAALEAMGHWGYLSGEPRLLIELPYDPQTDSVSWMTFLVDQGTGLVQVISQSDLALECVSEPDLDRYCRNFNRKSMVMEAVIHRPQEGARPRLRLTASLTNPQATTVPVLTEHLARLFRMERQFWSYLRRCRPS